MPAAPPAISAPDLESLRTLGSRLREARKRQGVTAMAAAEAAGLSRVTLYRIERGEPNVAIGSWVAVASALGMRLELAQHGAPPSAPEVPRRIRLEDYPQLRKLAWQLEGVEELTPREALELYERNWRHVDAPGLAPQERALIRALSIAIGGGRLLV